MATKTLEQFYAIALQDSTIQEQLKAATNQASFTNLVVELGAKNGYDFTSAEVNEMLAAAQDLSTKELSDDELEAVAGGRSSSRAGDLWTTLFGPC